MVGLTIFWCVIGGILSLVGFYFINHKSKKQRDYTVLGIVLLAIGIMVAVGAQLNIYINGTQEDLVRFMFWMKD
ncbi:hypothetical protein [Enterococcus mundtii]|uniref:hypothetical protein n=1 Tax=Enterococcus mundtii TaxID=53346 RepID=UPI000448E259|nr:hypothetical protein [Enterococcus mundtii]EYT95164.1 hypothetical protein AK89_09625 [Enterococcus mundtii CRL35]